MLHPDFDSLMKEAKELQAKAVDYETDGKTDLFVDAYVDYLRVMKQVIFIYLLNLSLVKGIYLRTPRSKKHSYIKCYIISTCISVSDDISNSYVMVSVKDENHKIRHVKYEDIYSIINGKYEVAYLYLNDHKFLNYLDSELKSMANK